MSIVDRFVCHVCCWLYYLSLVSTVCLSLLSVVDRFICLLCLLLTVLSIFCVHCWQVCLSLMYVVDMFIYLLCLLIIVLSTSCYHCLSLMPVVNRFVYLLCLLLTGLPLLLIHSQAAGHGTPSQHNPLTWALDARQWPRHWCLQAEAESHRGALQDRDQCHVWNYHLEVAHCWPLLRQDYSLYPTKN